MTIEAIFFVVLGLGLLFTALFIKLESDTATLLMVLLLFLGAWTSFNTAEAISDDHYQRRIEQKYNIKIRSHTEDHVIYDENCFALKASNDNLIHKGCESYEVGEEN